MTGEVEQVGEVLPIGPPGLLADVGQDELLGLLFNLVACQPVARARGGRARLPVVSSRGGQAWYCQVGFSHPPVTLRLE